MSATHLDLVLHVTAGRREARNVISHPERYGEQRRRIAWMALTGRHFTAPAHQPNLGAACPSPNWPMSATIISAGCESWGANDAR